MSIKAINPSLLIHEVILNGIAFSNVRVEQTSRMSSSQYGDIITSSHCIFVDKNNTPNYEYFKNQLEIGASVVYGNRTFTINNYEVLCGFEEHHLEVYLI